MTLRTELTNDTANTKPTDGPILNQFNSLTNLTIYIVQTYLLSSYLHVVPSKDIAYVSKFPHLQPPTPYT